MPPPHAASTRALRRCAPRGVASDSFGAQHGRGRCGLTVLGVMMVDLVMVDFVVVDLVVVDLVMVVAVEGPWCEWLSWLLGLGFHENRVFQLLLPLLLLWSSQWLSVTGYSATKYPHRHARCKGVGVFPANDNHTHPYSPRLQRCYLAAGSSLDPIPCGIALLLPPLSPSQNPTQIRKDAAGEQWNNAAVQKREGAAPLRVKARGGGAAISIAANRKHRGEGPGGRGGAPGEGRGPGEGAGPRGRGGARERGVALGGRGPGGGGAEPGIKSWAPWG
ncbi:unnamed protein product [Lampetra fluviatilis]